MNPKPSPAVRYPAPYNDNSEALQSSALSACIEGEMRFRREFESIRAKRQMLEQEGFYEQAWVLRMAEAEAYSDWSQSLELLKAEAKMRLGAGVVR